MVFCIRFSTTLVLSASLVACDDAATWEARRSLPKETQTAAYDYCARRMGLSHWLHLHKLNSRDGLVHVIGSDGSGVTVAEARSLNRCAWAKLDEIVSSK